MIGLQMGSFQNTITESPMNLSTVPPWARNASVSAAKWRDVWRIKLSGSAASAMPVKFVTSVNRMVTSAAFRQARWKSSHQQFL